MKKTTLLIATVAMASAIAFASGSAAVQASAATKPRIKIVATTFPIYDWAREVLGERLAEADLVLLQQSGVDLHSYSPSAADLRQIASCDLFMFVGGESDEWTERALAQKGNPRRRVLNLVKTLGSAAKEEKIVEGMEHEHHHHDADHDKDKDLVKKHDHDDDDHDHAKKHDHDEHGHAKKHDHDEDHDEDEHEIDEHVWLSLRHAATFVKAIAAELATVDQANAGTYRANADAYCAKLAALDSAYGKVVANAKRKTILVADRFPFRYLADDYGLEYFAAFSGCSAESEASFKTVMFLAKKVDALSLPAIVAMEGARRRRRRTTSKPCDATSKRSRPR